MTAVAIGLRLPLPFSDTTVTPLFLALSSASFWRRRAVAVTASLPMERRYSLGSLAPFEVVGTFGVPLFPAVVL